MEQLEKFKTIIYQIVGDNRFILAALESIRLRGNLLPSIELSDMGGSVFMHDINTIQLSVPDIIECYDLSKGCDIDLNYKIIFNTQYSNSDVRSEKCLGISLNMPFATADCEVIEELFQKSDFLKWEKMAVCDVVAIYSLAYSLYHEIGHVLHDKYIGESKPLSRERAADAFAFEAVKSMCDIENIDILLLGVFIGIIHVLDKRTQEQEIDDTKHPHSIERLYALLDFWRIPDNSYYWLLAYKVILKWSNMNQIPISWERENSITYKDKFIDAYIHFRKNPQL